MVTHTTVSAKASTVDTSENTHMPDQSPAARMGLAAPVQMSMPTPTLAPHTPEARPRLAGSYQADMMTGPAVMVAP